MQYTLGNMLGNGRALTRAGLLNGLVAYWKLNETSGTRYDSHGSRHLTDNRSVGYATGKIGNAADFDGLNGPLSTDSFFGGMTAITITAWVKIASLEDWQSIFGVENAGGGEGREVFFTASPSGLLVVAARGSDNDDSVLDTDFSITSNQWVFLQIRVTGGELLEARVNDEPWQSVAFLSPSIDSSTNPMLIGSGVQIDPLESPLTGLVDEVGVWERKLTDSEVSALYNGGSGITYEDF